MNATNDEKMIRVQASIPADIQARFKMICARRGLKVPEMILSLVEDFVQAEEEQWLDEVFAKRLQQAHDKKPLTDMPNVEAYYREVKGQAK